MSGSAPGFLGSVTVLLTLVTAYFACWLVGFRWMPRPVAGGPATPRSPYMQLRALLQVFLVLSAVAVAVAIKFMKAGNYLDYVRWEFQILGPVTLYLVAFRFSFVRSARPRVDRVREVGLEKASAERAQWLGRFLVGGAVVIGYFGHLWAGSAPWNAIYVDDYATFTAADVSFEYPSNWVIEEVSRSEFLTVTITTPETEDLVAPRLVVTIDRSGRSVGFKKRAFEKLLRGRDLPFTGKEVSVPGAIQAFDWEVEEEATGAARLIDGSIYARTVVAIGPRGEVVQLAVASPGDQLEHLRDDFDYIVGSLRLMAPSSHRTR
jgi:hypothetical protein